MQVVDIDGETGSSSLTSDEVGSVHLPVHFFSVAYIIQLSFSFVTDVAIFTISMNLDYPYFINTNLLPLSIYILWLWSLWYVDEFLVLVNISGNRRQKNSFPFIVLKFLGILVAWCSFSPKLLPHRKSKRGVKVLMVLRTLSSLFWSWH